MYTVAPSHDGLHFYQYMLAGSMASTAKQLAMYPLDTIKTRMQALRSSSSSCPINPLGLHQALTSILKSDCPAGLYRGISAMCCVMFLPLTQLDRFYHGQLGVDNRKSIEQETTPLEPTHYNRMESI